MDHSEEAKRADELLLAAQLGLLEWAAMEACILTLLATGEQTRRALAQDAARRTKALIRERNGRFAYSLLHLRRAGLIAYAPRTRRYRLTPQGARYLREAKTIPPAVALLLSQTDSMGTAAPSNPVL